MTNNTKTIIGVGVGVLLLLWLRNRNQSTDTLKGASAGDAGDDSTGDGSTGGGGAGGGSMMSSGGGISPNAIGGATTISPESTLGVGSPKPAVTKPLFNMPSMPFGKPSASKPMVSKPMVSKPMVSPVVNKVNTSFAKFDGSFRSPSSLDFDGNIED